MPLKTKDLNKVLTALNSAQRKWKYIGLALGLKPHELPKAQDDDLDNLRETLSRVLQRGAREWSDFVTALRSDNVAMGELADEIEGKYCESETDLGPPSTNRRKREHSARQATRSVLSSSGSSDEDNEVDVVGHLDSGTLEFHYDMKSGRHGKALIINIVGHPDPRKVRHGSNVDRDNLERTLTTIGYRVDKRENLYGVEKVNGDGGEIGKAVYNCANGEKNCDSFICCILAHGSQGKVMGADGVQVAIADIARRLVGIEHLKGKPKIFFFQACQGSEAPQPVEMHVADNATGGDYVPDVAIPTTLPRDSDFFYGCATSFETLSVRNTVHGSAYIQALCGVIENRYKTEDLVTMVTWVHQIVAEKTVHLKINGLKVRYKQQPQLVSTLRKLVLFK